MSNCGNIDATDPKSSDAPFEAHCSVYTFPDARPPASRGHLRSVSHGGGTAIGGGGTSGSAGLSGRPSALKGGRGHQRAFSQGQISDTDGYRPGHSRVGSKTDFILPPGHKEADLQGANASRSSAKGHSRQASRSESIYTLRRTAPPPLWRRLLCVLLRRTDKYDQEERYRIVVPNHTVPPKTPRKEHPNGRRPNNKIRTTKYTLLSFLPRNLLEQFHRVANLYFIFIVLLNWFPAINAFGKEIAMIPVMFVLGVTAVKDLFEDRRRHASDKRINNSTCRIYNRRPLCVLLRRTDKYDQEERYRIVVPNHTVPPKTPRKEHPNGRRPNNKIRTTKYTLLSFLPRNLLEQFHRVANLYFIFIVLLNWFPAINAFGKEIAMIPVMFVLGVTAVKDLFEDRRRHVSDKRINNSTCRIYNSEAARYKKVLWKEVRVGDLIHLSNNEVVPADILVLKSSDPSGLCYIDTGHLDGETNLKQRQVARGFVEKQNVFEPSKFKSRIEVDAPTTKIYRFHGAIIHPSGERVPVGTDNLLLRECLLKNTDYIEGIVVYAGHETKAMLNNGGPRYKRSSLERQMNQDVLWCVLILIFLCVVGAIGCKLWLNIYSFDDEPFKSRTNETTEAFLAFWTYIIILQIMIPLSLYVTLEMCKIIQVYHIHHNMDLYDPVMDKRTECRALNITEELGQIQYIFSDKTGTLTENRMIFRRCAIAGIDYNHSEIENEAKNGKLMSLTVVINPRLFADLHQGNAMTEHILANSRQAHAARIKEFLFLLAACNTVVCSRHPHYDLMNASGIIEHEVPNIFGQSEQSSDDSIKYNAPSMAGQGLSTSVNDKYARLEESRSVTPSPPLNAGLFEVRRASPHVPSLTPIDSLDSSPMTESAESSSKAQRPKLLNIPNINFLGKRNGSNSNLTDEQKVKLNRSITPSPFELKPIFEAESPDELALVDAAYSYNCRLLKRTPTHVSIELPEEGQMTFEILNTLPFDSTRKRMSVILKHPITNEIILYCKGADSAILPNVIPVEDDSEQKLIINKTQQHLNSYAREGLRVLVMAKRILSEEEYDDWSRKHREIELSLDNLDRKIRDSHSSIETKLTVLGATGIEDRLQEGVPETLQALISAGIVVWVLTGDKPETAINIAYSAKLFSPQMELLKLMARSKEAAERTIQFYLAEIEGTVDETPSTALDNKQDLLQPSSSTSSASSSRWKPSPKCTSRALVVDGKTLTFILDRRSNLTKSFLKLTTHCVSVLCCRATPLQKAYIVKVVKENLKMRTLAIGDGANDVSMIQTADVGIGISGQEGMQAVMAADFALPRFKFLEKFLLVHGHWSYDRLSRMVLYFFYKNAAFVFLIFWYQLYCGFSGAVMIDQMYLMLYNLLFTSLPPIAIGVYDQDSPEELLREKPYLYRQGRLGKVYRPYSFWLTMADAVYQSICIFFICRGVYADTEIDIFEFGTNATTACMFVMLLHVSLEIRSWTIIHVGSILISIGLFYLYSILYNSLCVNCFGLPSTYWIIQKAMTRPTYWLITLLASVVSVLPRLVFRVVKIMVAPDEVSRAIIAHRRNTRRGEGFLVSWSRSTSASSIYRTTSNRNQNNTLTAVG